METLNIYDRKTGAYLWSITRTTSKECLAIAADKYLDLAWDWDDRNPVKVKRSFEQVEKEFQDYEDEQDARYGEKVRLSYVHAGQGNLY